jgi:hypothetical protein
MVEGWTWQEQHIAKNMYVIHLVKYIMSLLVVSTEVNLRCFYFKVPNPEDARITPLKPLILLSRNSLHT